ncbi:MAG TPA: FAD-dependent oxidoreductase, partial [Vicinamibacteria bacterium]|nr:FAD-dependent oxidoreductase [Vicinamibacteria bacterium]
ERGTDAIVVGAGISGLSAALEAARGGASVLVVDMWSIFGGHAVMSHGGLCIVGTPAQEAAGIRDSHELAEKDFLTWGEDAHPGWVSFYVRNSRELIYDWVSGMGVTFSGGVTAIPGNSVARFHNPDGRGLGLVSPIYRACLLNPNVRFLWNFKVDGLVLEEDRVVGIRGQDTRTREPAELRAPHVVLATGGFQSNLDMVREHWPEGLEFPELFLAGSGLNSVGSGHEVAQRAGAQLFHMDHQWNYATGLPDPRYPGKNRGLNASNGAAIWLNLEGKRFVNELESTKVRFRALLEQKPARYWAIFDEKSKRQLFVSGSDWADFETIERHLLSNQELVKKADTIVDLARAAGLPPDVTAESVRRYNQMVEEGADHDYHRFGKTATRGYDLTQGSDDGEPAPVTIDTPPFYALPFYPLSRKSMGGVRIDLEAHVLDGEGRPIPGLYAVGELSGFGGINGKAGLEGTFLGPSIVTGRVVGRTILSELERQRSLVPTTEVEAPPRPTADRDLDQTACVTCHDLEEQIASPRWGYSHFEKVHRIVGERGAICSQCHAEMFPYDSDRHAIDRLSQVETCKSCHLAAER